MRHPASPQNVLYTLLGLAVIALFGVLYSAALFGRDGLDPGFRIQGIEHERLSGILIPVEMGLGLSERAPGIGHLPAWNPYLGTGTPLLNNAFLYLYNPFMSLPVLLMGAVQGAKIALIINLLLAGLNMWALARAIGLGRLARVTTAVLYLMSGGILSRFHSGHFQLGLSLVWLPLVFAGLWWTLHTTDRRAPVLMAVAFALLFFSGNIYYTLHALVCCTVMTLICVVGERLNPSRVIRRVLIAALLTLGLTAIQLIPIWLVRDYVTHQPVDFSPDTGQIASQYSLGQSLANLTIPWESWQALQNPPLNLIASVDYAYIGILPFALIAGLIFVGIGRFRLIAVIAMLLAIIMMIWGAGQTVIVNELYRRIRLLAEFRYVGRANAVAALWWIVLAGIALDQFWHALKRQKIGKWAIRIVLVLLALFAAIDTLRVNHALIELNRPVYSFGSLYAATYGTGTDLTTPFPSILEPHGPSTYDAYYSRIRTWGLNEGWTPRPVANDPIPAEAPKLPSLPQWAIVSTEYVRGGTYELARQFVEQHNGELVQCISRDRQAADPCDLETAPGSILYRIPAALPYAFAADAQTLQSRADTLIPQNVQPVTSVDHRMDTITIHATAPGEGHYLIVQEAHFPGWHAQIDGTSIETVTVGARVPNGPFTSFIGIPMQPGAHEYTLRYETPGFGIGAIISLLSVVMLVGYISGMRLPVHLRRK